MIAGHPHKRFDFSFILIQMDFMGMSKNLILTY